MAIDRLTIEDERAEEPDPGGDAVVDPEDGVPVVQEDGQQFEVDDGAAEREGAECGEGGGGREGGKGGEEGGSDRG